MKIRSKLMAATAMLLVSAVMMTTASFAWFTISTAPEITGVAASATANGNLEIALASTDGPGDSNLGDTGDNTKWGNIITLTDSFADVILKPVQLDGATVKVPTFGNDGRLNSALTSATKTGTGVVTYVVDDEVWAIGIEFLLRSNVDGAVYLSGAADRGNGVEGTGTSLTVGNDSYKSYVKVALVEGNAASVTFDGSATTIPTDAVVTLTKNESKTVTAILYMDGTSMKNENFTNANVNVSLNLQFKHEETLVPMGMTGTETTA